MFVATENSYNIIYNIRGCCTERWKCATRALLVLGRLTFKKPVLLSRLAWRFFTSPYSENRSCISSSWASSCTLVINKIHPSTAVMRLNSVQWFYSFKQLTALAVSSTCPTADPPRKQQTFHDTTDLLVKWRLRNRCRNSMLITRHHPDLGNVMSSVWNSCILFSDITSWGNQWCWQQQHF